MTNQLNKRNAVEIYFFNLKIILEEKGNPFYAEKQAKYLKNHFLFYGHKAPQWMAIFNNFVAENGFIAYNQLSEFIRLCFEDDHREMQYMAIEMSQRLHKQWESCFIEDLEFMITNKSWWDSVDWISKLVGMYFKKFPEQKYMYFEKWKTSKNMWLNRISIIFQLHYKQATDFELIKEAIVFHENSKEFFIRKAAGWALRTYSRYEPKKILDFIDEHPNLSGLTKREAIRNINL